MKLSKLKTGEKGIIVKVLGHGGFRKRIIEMGFIKGKEVEVLQNAPLQDPVIYKLMGYEVSLRHQEADMIEIVSADMNQGDRSLDTLGTNDHGPVPLIQLTSYHSPLKPMRTTISNISPNGSGAPSMWRSWAIPTVARPRSSTMPAERMVTWATIAA